MDVPSELARFAASATPPMDAAARTQLILADCLGAIAGGIAEPEVRAFARSVGADGAATLIGTAQRASPPDAALVNGTAGTALEMDEGHQFARGHPGIHTVPAALAFAEVNGSSGRDLIAAIAVGYDVGARIALASRLNLAMHPHGTWGTICAAVAVARLAGADAAAMREVINVAATLGLSTSRRTMLEGATVRNAFAGVAAKLGLLANDLVQAGFSGGRDDVAHIYGHVASDAFDGAAALEGLGERWEVSRNYFKLHACCRYNHAALDALTSLCPLPEPDAVSRIEVETYDLAAELSEPAPSNVLGAKFSLPFALATTLLNRSSGVESFSREAVDDARIKALAAQVSVREDKAMTAALPDRRPARVTLHLTDGTRFCAMAETNRGDFADPYTEAELREKFGALTARVWPCHRSKAVWDAVQNLDTSDGAASLYAAVNGR